MSKMFWKLKSTTFNCQYILQKLDFKAQNEYFLLKCLWYFRFLSFMDSMGKKLITTIFLPKNFFYKKIKKITKNLKNHFKVGQIWRVLHLIGGVGSIWGPQKPLGAQKIGWGPKKKEGGGKIRKWLCFFWFPLFLGGGPKIRSFCIISTPVYAPKSNDLGHFKIKIMFFRIFGYLFKLFPPKPENPRMAWG